MLMFRALPLEGHTYTEAVLDPLLLALFSTPLIYIWVIKPFVIARDEALAEATHLALTDQLTKLANRRLIYKQLETLISICVRHKDYGAVLLLDLDGFKSLNDNHGHEAGDAMLVEVAKRLRSNLRSEDSIGRLDEGSDIGRLEEGAHSVVGRMGGDEFIVLIHHLDSVEQLAQDKVKQIAEKLILKLSEPITFNGNMLHVGVSIGIRLLGLEAVRAENAIGDADTAMYRAKDAGKGRAVFF